MYKAVRRTAMYSEYTPKKIKTKRIFYVFDPGCHVEFLWSLVPILFCSVGLLKMEINAPAKLMSILITALFILFSTAAITTFNKPKGFEILGNRVEFSTYLRLNIPSDYGRKSHYPRVKVHYTITDAKILSRGQSSLERAFDVGHVTFTGNITFTADKYLENIPETSCFVFYGIKEFSKALAIIENEIKNGRKDSYYD